MKHQHHILTLGSKVGIHLVHQNNKTQTWSEFEGDYVRVEHLNKLREKYPDDSFGIVTADAQVVRLVSCRFIQEIRPAYIPVIYDTNPATASKIRLETYRKHVTRSRMVRDFPWYEDAYWNRFVGGDTQFCLTEIGHTHHAAELEFPNGAAFRSDSDYAGHYLSTEREQCYHYSESTEDGPVIFEFEPELYELELDAACTVQIIAGRLNRLLKLPVITTAIQHNPHENNL